MPPPKPLCFFVMPFSAEMHYFYLYVRKHVEERHNLICERADDRVTTLPLSEKVRAMIQKADVIIADCTDRNPNVMYELGLAHAFERKVVLLTRDPIESIPTDLRQFEFVKYDAGDHVNFLQRLDGAMDAIFKQRYDAQLKTAEDYFEQISAVCPIARRATAEEFMRRYRAADASGEVISPAKLLSFIVSNHTEPEVMSAIVDFEKKERAAVEPANEEPQAIVPEENDGVK